MLSKARLACGLAPILMVCGCSGPETTRAAPPVLNEKSTELPAEIHLSGTTRAVHFFNVQVPQISSSQGGQGGRLMYGGNDMGITFLREPGELVHPGDEVVRLDTTEQEFKLREAEADLAEAEQHIVQAQADAEASEEEDR